MDAVIFHGPFDIRVEKRSMPTIQDNTDAIVKVQTAGLCGSELHMYRGLQETKSGHIMGHEFVGTIEQLGPSVSNFSLGDRVICPFSSACMNCWFCQQGHTNRCVHGAAFGTQLLAGGQAEYVRVPFADGTLSLAPNQLSDEILIMMSDIFPTGYYGATRALASFGPPRDKTAMSNGNGNARGFHQQSISDAVVVCLGCGPVGLCAIITAKARGVGTLYAVDSVDDRLAEAEKFGAIPLQLGRHDVHEVIKEVTDGRGADAVIELVGNKSALRSAFDLVRPCGVLSSVGFHQGDLPFTALECYQKNLSMNFGRAPVRAVFDEALACLSQNQEKLATFISHKMPLQDAAAGYHMFEKHLARKVVFTV